MVLLVCVISEMFPTVPYTAEQNTKYDSGWTACTFWSIWEWKWMPLGAPIVLKVICLFSGWYTACRGGPIGVWAFSVISDPVTDQVQLLCLEHLLELRKRRGESTDSHFLDDARALCQPLWQGQHFLLWKDVSSRGQEEMLILMSLTWHKGAV